MSPELLNYKPYSFKSDLWSLGCVLYEICNLKHAFNAQTINGLAIKILKGNFSPVCSRYSKELRELVHALLDTNPKTRPSIAKLACLPTAKKHIQAYVARLAADESLPSSLIELVRAQTITLGLPERPERPDPRPLRLRPPPPPRPQPAELPPPPRQTASPALEAEVAAHFADEDEFDFLEEPEANPPNFEDSFDCPGELDSLRPLPEPSREIPDELRLISRLSERVSAVQTRVFAALGAPLAAQAIDLVAKAREGPEATQNAFLALVGEKNLGYWHIIEQLLYFRDEIEHLNAVDIR